MDGIILGYGSAHTTISIGTSFVIGESILVDAPPSIAKKMLREHMDISNIDTILISHLHGDHFFGLPLFLLERRMNQPQTELNIYGPRNLIACVMDMLILGFPENDYSTFFEENKIHFFNIEDHDFLEVHGLQIRHLKVRHTIEAFGFEFIQPDGKRLFYSADTEYFDALGEKIKLADICLLDATSSDNKIPGHMSLLQLKELAAQYPDKLIYATHRGGYRAVSTGNLKIPDENNDTRFTL